MAAVLHRSFVHRATVDLVPGGAAPADALAALFARAPSGEIVRSPAGVALREEPPWFFAVVFGGTLGVGILAHVTGAHVRAHAWAAHACGVVLHLVALWALGRLAASLVVTRELFADGGALRWRTRLAGRTLREVRVDAQEVLASLVVGRVGQRRVVLVGARNAELLCVYRERWMDPTGLATWIADVAALVATEAARAGLRTIR